MLKTENSNNQGNEIINQVYKKCSLKISNFKIETESKEYNACQFNLNNLKIICRNAKITPKKVGQFVTFWKREINQPIAPFDENDTQIGQFVFPKAILIKKGIISTNKKEGKRAFRIYPPWDKTTSKQAEQSQKWQVDYFYEILDEKDLAGLLKLYEK